MSATKQHKSIQISKYISKLKSITTKSHRIQKQTQEQTQEPPPCTLYMIKDGKRVTLVCTYTPPHDQHPIPLPTTSITDSFGVNTKTVYKYTLDGLCISKTIIETYL